MQTVLKGDKHNSYDLKLLRLYYNFFNGLEITFTLHVLIPILNFFIGHIAHFANFEDERAQNG